MTPREFFVLGDAWLEDNTRKSGRLTKDELTELDTLGREAVAREAAATT